MSGQRLSPSFQERHWPFQGAYPACPVNKYFYSSDLFPWSFGARAMNAPRNGVMKQATFKEAVERDGQIRH